MARTLYALGAVNQAVGAKALNYEKSASYASAGGGSVTITGHTSSLQRLCGFGTIAPAHNAADWPTAGTIATWSVDITTSTATSTTCTTGLERYSSDGGTDRLSNSNAPTLNASTTGIKTGSFNDSSLNSNASRTADDMVEWILSLTGSSSHTVGTLVVRDASSFVTLTNFTAPSTTPRVVDRQRRALQAVSRASVW